MYSFKACRPLWNRNTDARPLASSTVEADASAREQAHAFFHARKPQVFATVFFDRNIFNTIGIYTAAVIVHNNEVCILFLADRDRYRSAAGLIAHAVIHRVFQDRLDGQ